MKLKPIILFILFILYILMLILTGCYDPIEIVPEGSLTTKEFLVMHQNVKEIIVDDRPPLNKYTNSSILESTTSKGECFRFNIDDKIHEIFILEKYKSYQIGNTNYYIGSYRECNGCYHVIRFQVLDSNNNKNLQPDSISEKL